jgi:sec-independent protein translocase protein TatA
MASTLPLFAPMPGGMEMVVILLVLVLLFGANKIPKLARSTGQAMGEFQKGRQQVEQELEEMEEEVKPDTDVSSGSSASGGDGVDLDNEQPDEDFDLDADEDTA